MTEELPGQHKRLTNNAGDSYNPAIAVDGQTFMWSGLITHRGTVRYILKKVSCFKGNKKNSIDIIILLQTKGIVGNGSAFLLQ